LIAVAALWWWISAVVLRWSRKTVSLCSSEDETSSLRRVVRLGRVLLRWRAISAIITLAWISGHDEETLLWQGSTVEGEGEVGKTPKGDINRTRGGPDHCSCDDSLSPPGLSK